MIKETEKYDVGKALHRPPLKNALSHAIDHNDQLDLKNVVDDGASLLRLSKEDISKIISAYNFGAETGLGVMFVVESFSKKDNKGAMWLTFINIDTREVIYTERFVGV